MAIIFENCLAIVTIIKILVNFCFSNRADMNAKRNISKLRTDIMKMSDKSEEEEGRRRERKEEESERTRI